MTETLAIGRPQNKKRLGLCLLMALWPLAAPLACATDSTDATGGETHFLRVCVDDIEACGSALSCLCGVCTVACQIQESCAALPGATCSAKADGSCAVSGNVCEVTCTDDGDCASLSAEHRCIGGACRSAPSEPTDGAAGAENGSGGSGVGTCTPGVTAPNEVLVIGDTFFATSHQITAYLEDLARGSGALEAGERYRDSSRMVANALALSSRGILDQYQSAAAEAEVSVVVMNGGGADALLGSCETVDSTCPVLSAAAAALDEVLQTMAEDGVTGVVFAGYPDPVPEGVRAKMDALRPLLEASCQAAAVPCAWVDLRETFAGHYEEYVLADGMNPTAAGSEASANAIWAALQQNCWAQ